MERMNAILKNHITKLMIESRLALLRIRTAPSKDIGVSPNEMLLGLPYLGREEGLPMAETNDLDLRNHLQAIALSLMDLRRKELLTQTSPLDFHIRQVKPGDWVLINLE